MDWLLLIKSGDKQTDRLYALVEERHAPPCREDEVDHCLGGAQTAD